MKKLFLLLLLISTPAMAQTYTDTVLPNGSVQRVTTPNCPQTTQVFTAAQYTAMLQAQQARATAQASRITAMQATAAQVTSILQALPVLPAQPAPAIGH